MGEHRRRLVCATGVFLTLLGLYLLTAPGRIDIIDGQWRYEVTKNWLDRGEPQILDRLLLRTRGQQVDPRTGKSYSVYNAAPSLTPMPLMLLSRLLPGHHVERDHFAFSLVGPLFGAILGALLILGYGLLGVRLRESLIFTGIFCIATLWWPASVTVFDQNQHAAFLLSTLLVGWMSGRRRSIALAGMSGLLGGLLLNYQEMYALLLPVAGLAVLASRGEGSPGQAATLQRSPDRAALMRYLIFGLGCVVGLALFFAFNQCRFGIPLLLGKYGRQDAIQPPIFGNPISGFLGLACSPGKGILWFSPPLLLTGLGLTRLYQRAPALTLAVVGVSICHVLVIVHLAFFGGDWCWGPRYLIPVMPLWALAFPFATERLRRPRHVVAPLVAAGLLVQVLGVSLDAHQFFLERSLPGTFWANDPWFYFRESQLISRPFEIVASLRNGLPSEAVRVSSSPFEATYCPLGSPRPEESRSWMRHFQMFYLPRPWWGWMWRVPRGQQPADPTGLLVACLGLLIAGGTSLTLSLRQGSSSEVLALARSAAARSYPSGAAPECTYCE